MRTILATISTVLEAYGAAVAPGFNIAKLMDFNIGNLFDREYGPANTARGAYFHLQSLIQ